MNVAFVSTYPPRPCGLATFTQDLRRAALGAHAIDEAPVVSMVRGKQVGERLPEVVYEVNQDSRAAHIEAAEFLNASDVDAVSLQHEFGIFGGQYGVYLLDFLDALEKPVLSTFHTVLPQPKPVMRRVLEAVAHRSDRVMVMAETARSILRDVYGVDSECVDVIPHGVPDLPHTPDLALRRALDAEDRTLLMTFGLLGPTKGIEFALNGLARVVREHPEALFLIVGATHPEIVRRDGEAYRESLEARVDRLGLRDHVRFVDRYLSNEELGAFLRTTDLYVSPYPGMDQICSGTLAYAVGAGCAVVSTPYLHARELLGEERGCLVPFDDAEMLADTFRLLLGDAGARAEYRERAYAYGRSMVWSAVGERLARVMDRLAVPVSGPALSAGDGLVGDGLAGDGESKTVMLQVAEVGSATERAVWAV